MDPDSHKNPKIWNWWFLSYLVLVIIFGLLFRWQYSNWLNFTCLGMLILIQFVFNIKIQYELKFKIINWFSFFLLILVSIAYTLTKLNNVGLALFTLLVAVFITFLVALIVHVLNLWKSKGDRNKRVITTITYYLALAFTGIILFGYIFALIGINHPENSLKFTGVNNTLNGQDYIYFSAVTFYSGALGDIIPLGYSKMVMVMELAFSYIIHIIILGIVISKFGYNSNERK
ncbi:MAG: hypothetical protein WCV90_07225 [Candidatus Woesearchaeota archaeon]